MASDDDAMDRRGRVERIYTFEILTIIIIIITLSLKNYNLTLKYC